MAIANAVQRGPSIYVYDEKNRQLFVKAVGYGPNDGLKGYTSGSVNIQSGGLIYMYDEKGHQIGATAAPI